MFYYKMIKWALFFYGEIYIIENLKRRKINKFVNDISKNIDIIKYYRKIQNVTKM